MNYLVTHYKNLAEQLQARINHIQQCLYEMDKAAGGGGGGLNTPEQTTPSIGLPKSGTPTSTDELLQRGRDLLRTNTPEGVPPWKIQPPPADGTVYYYMGQKYICVPGGWAIWDGVKYVRYYEGNQS